MTSSSFESSRDFHLTINVMCTLISVIKLFKTTVVYWEIAFFLLEMRQSEWLEHSRTTVTGLSIYPCWYRCSCWIIPTVWNLINHIYVNLTQINRFKFKLTNHGTHCVILIASSLQSTLANYKLWVMADKFWSFWLMSYIESIVILDWR